MSYDEQNFITTDVQSGCGSLKAYFTGDPGYDGIAIEFTPDGDPQGTFDPVVVEMDHGHLKVIVFRDQYDEQPEIFYLS